MGWVERTIGIKITDAEGLRRELIPSSTDLINYHHWNLRRLATSFHNFFKTCHYMWNFEEEKFRMMKTFRWRSTWPTTKLFSRADELRHAEIRRRPLYRCLQRFVSYQINFWMFALNVLIEIKIVSRMWRKLIRYKESESQYKWPQLNALNWGRNTSKRKAKSSI